MTAQVPDNLENRNPRVDFGQLALYRIVTGDPYGKTGRFEFPVKPSHPPNTVLTSVNWRGYRATLVLNEDGSLVLQSYEFATSDSEGIGSILFVTQPVGVCLTGDFWLMCMESFHGAITYIPFRNGLIVEDRTQWKRWFPPPTETISKEAWKIRELIDLQRRTLRNTPAKRMLKACLVTPRKFVDNQWVVYDLDVKIVYDADTDLYSPCDCNDQLGVFSNLSDLIARLDSEIDPSRYPNVLGERISLLAKWVKRQYG